MWQNLDMFGPNILVFDSDCWRLLQLRQGTRADQLSRMPKASVGWTSLWFTLVDASLLFKRSTWPPAWRTTSTCLQVWSRMSFENVPPAVKSPHVFFCLCSGRKLGWHRPGGAPPVCRPGVGSVKQPHEPQFSQHLARDDPARTFYSRVPAAQRNRRRWGRRPAAWTGGGGADRRSRKHRRSGACSC